MTYNIIDHGEWESYTPAENEVPENVPQWALFARRKSDLVDWYVYIYPNVDPPPPLKIDPKLRSIKHTVTHRAAPRVALLSFGAGTIKCAAAWSVNFNAYIVGPVTSDASRIFPAGRIVFEIDYPGTESEAFAEFNGKAYDPATFTFTDPVPPPPPEAPVKSRFDALLDRVAELEKEIKRMTQERG